MANVGDKINGAEPGWSNISFGNGSITYTGMTKGVSYAYGGGTASYSFTFTGTAVRIITGLFSDGATRAEIKIDNTVEYANFKGTSGDPHIVYEKTKLPYGTHTITVRSNNTGTLSLMAIHYAAFANVGDKLDKPELGWQRHKFNEKLSDGTEAIRYYPENIWNAYTDKYIYTKEKDVGYIRFKFYGSAIRIISTHFSDTATMARITIDGTLSYYNSRGGSDGDRLSFENSNLPLGIHTVEIHANNSGNLGLSAIDLKDGEYLVPLIKVGDILTKPEPGWKRFDDTDSNIEYKGVWATEKSPTHYNSTCHYKHSSSNKPPDSNPISIKFNFKGTKLRIIGFKGNSYDSDAKILIDGKEEVINFKSTEFLSQCIVYEKLNLSSGVHTVEVKGIYMTLDAIDIDADGSLFTPAKVGDTLKEPEPGWKRFDDTDERISYNGLNWQISTNSGALDHYNQTNHYRIENDSASVEFYFKGNGIRIIGAVYNWKPVSVQLDGINIGSYTPNIPNATSFGQVLLYEKKDLNSDIHHIKLIGTTMMVDAFDILGGELFFKPVKVGDVLKEPESGWKRFDDRDPNIHYQGNWIENENITTHYRGTFHNKPSSSGDDSIVRALFDFSGTKLRIIAFMTTGSYDVGTIKIDGEAFNFSYIKGTPTAQCLVFEKLGLEPGVHKVELSGRYINLDAIDIDETGELIPIETKKPKVSLYEKESGKIFVDDFDSINPKWLMSPFTAFNNVAKQGFLRMNHSADKDALLLIDKPQGNVAIQVIADYTPTKEGDKGGLLIYKNEANNIEFLESMKVSDSPDPKEWMAVCKENQWDFYNKTDVMFDYVRSEQLEAHKIGVVLKKGNTEGFTPLDINKIIITTSNLLRLRQLYEKYKVVLKDAAENVISTSFVEVANTGIDIPLPSLEFEGIVEIYDEDGTLVAKRQTTFFGGDMYCMGSSLHISMDTKELDETDPTHLGYMTETERLVKMTLTNDNVGPVSNVKVAIQQYMEKFGYTWAHLSLDGSHYTDELSIETLDAGSSKDFWVKIIKDVNYMAFEPIYFNIHLSHD
ncbi:protein containing cell adhesion domain protein [Bacillus paramobilis]|uniref:protein containing cell adhesion domain protein n=1 Tax=Bacillus paramobilis TaxID=2817477 RepID=UPI003D1E50D0